MYRKRENEKYFFTSLSPTLLHIQSFDTFNTLGLSAVSFRALESKLPMRLRLDWCVSVAIVRRDHNIISNLSPGEREFATIDEEKKMFRYIAKEGKSLTGN